MWNVLSHIPPALPQYLPEKQEDLEGLLEINKK
jgi:hypothetical protein